MMTNLNHLIEKAPDHILRKFARKCAFRHIEKIKPYCGDYDYQLIVKWLETGDESIREAACSACSAYAADSAADAADAAADSAADSAGHSDAWDAWDAEREWQEQTLREMMEV